MPANLETFSERLDKAILDANLTQKEVAYKLGVTGPAVTGYRRKSDRLKWDTIYRIATAVQCSGIWLKTGRRTL